MEDRVTKWTTKALGAMGNLFFLSIVVWLGSTLLGAYWERKIECQHLGVAYRHCLDNVGDVATVDLYRRHCSSIKRDLDMCSPYKAAIDDLFASIPGTWQNFSWTLQKAVYENPAAMWVGGVLRWSFGRMMRMGG